MTNSIKRTILIIIIVNFNSIYFSKNKNLILVINLCWEFTMSKAWCQVFTSITSFNSHWNLMLFLLFFLFCRDCEGKI